MNVRIENHFSQSVNNVHTTVEPWNMLGKDNEKSRNMKQRNEMKIYEREEVHYLKIKEKI